MLNKEHRETIEEVKREIEKASGVIEYHFDDLNNLIGDLNEAKDEAATDDEAVSIADDIYELERAKSYVAIAQDNTEYALDYMRNV